VPPDAVNICKIAAGYVDRDAHGLSLYLTTASPLGTAPSAVAGLVQSTVKAADALSAAANVLGSCSGVSDCSDKYAAVVTAMGSMTTQIDGWKQYGAS
jgi:hypothetical protein